MEAEPSEDSFMNRRLCASCVALFVWALALVGAAEETSERSVEIEPSLMMFRQLDARAELSEEQRAFFEPYFHAHADHLRGMKSRLNAGELSYVGALMEGRALRRELDAQASERLDDAQVVALSEIRSALRGEFRALFFKEEHVWLFRLFGQSGATTSPAETLADSDGGNS
jgi:hypothetical protein